MSTPASAQAPTAALIEASKSVLEIAAAEIWRPKDLKAARPRGAANSSGAASAAASKSDGFMLTVAEDSRAHAFAVAASGDEAQPASRTTADRIDRTLGIMLNRMHHTTR